MLRRAVWPLRDAISSLRSEMTPFITDETRIYLRDCYDHAVQLIDLLESYRDIAGDVRDYYLSTISNRMNEIMKTLTVIATIFLPLSFIAGVYGMNFNTEVSKWNMPELNWRYGYLYSLAFMLLVAVGMLWWFKWRGWLERLTARTGRERRRRETVVRSSLIRSVAHSRRSNRSAAAGVSTRRGRQGAEADPSGGRRRRSSGGVESISCSRGKQADAVGDLDRQARAGVGFEHDGADLGIDDEVDADVAHLERVGELHRGGQQVVPAGDLQAGDLLAGIWMARDRAAAADAAERAAGDQVNGRRGGALVQIGAAFGLRSWAGGPSPSPARGGRG